ncbi:MAG TPA: efflux RND transporter permease subunit [Pseudogracilibacillus sp.]|nr:efflux RND transporter permease subunit [Pseudogracilibacillus sp.]
MLQFLLKRKIVVGLFVFLTFGLGLYSFTKLDRELLPSITFNQALVVVSTKEMPTEDVEEAVTKPIEQMLESMDGVDEYMSTTTMNDSTIFVTLDGDDSSQLVTEIESKVSNVTNQLPIVEDMFVMQAAMSGQYEFVLDISGESMKEMSTFANDVVKPRLESLKEVNEVLVVGATEKEIIVTLDEEKLTRYDVTKEDIVQQVEQMNTNHSIGTLEKESGKPTLRWTESLQSKKDIENIPLMTNEGVKKLKTVATVKEKEIEDTNVAWKNGNPDFLLVQIARTSDVTAIDMTKSVREEIKAINKEYDNGVTISEVAAQADYVENAIDGVKDNIIAGGIIAIIVLLLFLRNIRATFIISLSIPASILLTIITMTLLDYSFNLLSLIGLGLGIGMLVDAAIVVLESIFKKKELGYANKRAVIDGTKEVIGAVIASMLTTIVVFIPFVLLDEEVGKIVIILTVVISVTLISSVLVAFTLIPVLAENFLKVKKRKRGKLQLIERYGSIVSWITAKKRNRIGILSLFIVIFVGSFFFLSKIPTQFMPDILDRYAEVVIELDEGATAEKREELALKIDEELNNIPDIESTIVLDNLGLLYTVINMTDESEQTMEQREVNELILKKLRALEDDYPIKYVGSAIEGAAGFPIELRVYGEDFTVLNNIADEVKEEVEKIDAISTVEVGRGETSQQLTLQFDEKKLNEANMTPLQIQHFLIDQFSDVEVGEITRDDGNVPIIVRYDETIESKKALLNTKINSPFQEEKLSTYVSLKEVEMVNEIERANGERYISIRADMEGQQVAYIHNEISNIMNDSELDQGYHIEVVGDLEEQKQATEDLLVIFALALFLVFLVMAIQFNSLKHPFIILLIIPFTITGVLIGLVITGKEFNIMSGIGIVMLVGIVLNNGILLIDRIKQLRNDQIEMNSAVVQAAKDRIRPIFMTTLTTAGGMLPLAMATGTSSGYQSPLAVVVISGLLFSTFITLLLIPSVYLLFEDINRGFKKLFTRRKKQKHEKTA